MNFNGGKVIHCSVTKADIRQPTGLKIEATEQQQQHNNKKQKLKVYVSKISHGLFQQRKVPIQVGDQIVSLNGKDTHLYDTVNEMKFLIKNEKQINLVILRRTNNGDGSSSNGNGTGVGYEHPAHVNFVEDDDDDNEEEADYEFEAYFEQDHNQDEPHDSRRGQQKYVYSNTNSSDDDDEEEEDYFEYDRTIPRRLNSITNTNKLQTKKDRHRHYNNARPQRFNKNNENIEIKSGSIMQLDNVRKKPIFNGLQVYIVEESQQEPGQYECEFADGSRINLSSKYLYPIDETEEDGDDDDDDDEDDISSMGGSTSMKSALSAFQRYVPNSSTRSFIPNLIEAGDIMKIRGLKKQAKMNGTMVEILRPAEQVGRWECIVCDNRERVIAVLSENLRHIM